MIRLITSDTVGLVFDYPLAAPEDIVVRGNFADAELQINAQGEWTGVKCKLLQWELFLWESAWALTWLPPSRQRNESLQMLAYYRRELKQMEWAALLK